MSNGWPEWMKKRVGAPVDLPRGVPEPTAELTDPTVRKLLGPKGETLRTFSDRPPVGFHQGQRS